MKKADVAMIARSFVSHLPTREQTMLAKRHKLTPNQTTSVEAAFLTAINGCDETALCRLLLEASLMDAVSQPVGKGEPDLLTETAKRYRIDCERMEKAVTAELAAKQKKQETKPAKGKNAA